jgi:hypothetical protein
VGSWWLGVARSQRTGQVGPAHDHVSSGAIWQHCPVANEEVEGWFTDPFGRHEARWMSGDTPTDLVRDGRAEGHDPVPDEPSLANPVRVEYVEQDNEPDRFLKSKGGVAVPGGIVTIEPHQKSDGDVPRAKVLLQSVTAIGSSGHSGSDLRAGCPGWRRVLLGENHRTLQAQEIDNGPVPAWASRRKIPSDRLFVASGLSGHERRGTP